MYIFLLILQYIGMAIGIFEVTYILKQPRSKYQALMLGVMLSVFLNSLGYLFEMKATTKELALQAVKFNYFGKTFAPLFFMLFLLEYCRIKLPKIIKILLFLLHITILVLVQTCDSNTLFYTSIDYTHSGLFPHLILGHSIIYNAYSILLVCYLIIVPIFCIIKTKKDFDSNEHSLLIHLAEILITMAIGFGLFLSGITRGYDSTAIAFVISETILLYALMKEGMLETLAVAKDYVADNIAQGVVIIQKNKQILYCNETSKKIYPELDKNEYQNSVNEIIRLNKDNDLKFSKDKVYKISDKEITKENRNICTIFVMEDITGEYYYADRLKRDVYKKTRQIERMQRSVIASFSEVVEARDGDTGQHVKRTSQYVEILTKALAETGIYKDQLNAQKVQMIIDAAPLHDIGKISIPDSILTKPGKLTDDEFEIIKTHSVIGARLIRQILKNVEHDDYINVAEDMAQYHHEKWNGGGYPSGLSGQKIPLSARIMAVADVYDALCSKRSYKKPFTKEKAYEIIVEGSGNHFDPEIVKVFCDNIREIEKVGAND